MKKKYKQLREEIKRFKDDIYGDDDNALFDRNGNNVSRQVENWIIKALQQQREEIVNEMVKLSDRIELEGETFLEEWKAFKHFRNTMRDTINKTI